VILKIKIDTAHNGWDEITRVEIAAPDAVLVTLDNIADRQRCTRAEAFALLLNQILERGV